MFDLNTTVAAIATAQGIGGIGVVRISGNESLNIASKIFVPFDKNFKLKRMSGYTAKYGKIMDSGREIDDAILLYFKAPNSYTGEDIVEISCHGGLFLTKRVLQLALDFGAELAGPGEFTKRAFLNGKIDLLQSESVNDLINAETSRANKLAMSQKNGAYRKKIFEIRDNLKSILAKLAAQADYPEETESFNFLELSNEISAIKLKISTFLKNYEVGKMLKNGINAVIVGAPNVGKSEFMNYLSGFEKSIVTEFAGTTRDIVQEKIFLCGIPIFISDTAGIHETSNLIEKIGIQKAREELDSADLVFYVFDGSRAMTDEEFSFFSGLKKENLICVINKVDLPKKICEEKILHMRKVEISAKEKFGLEEVQEAILSVLNLQVAEAQNDLVANERHFRILKKVEKTFETLEESFSTEAPIDTIITLLENALNEIFQLTGERTSDAIIDEIFSNFCVGK